MILGLSTLLLVNFILSPTRCATTTMPTHRVTHWNDDCPNHPDLSPMNWQKMDLDEYLAHYPNGNILTFSDYLHQLPLEIPFECGLGKTSHLTPICEPIRGPDWYILFAVHQWNKYVNSLSTALHASYHLSKRVVPQILNDFVKDYESDKDSHSRIMSEHDILRVLLEPIYAGGPDSSATIDNDNTDKADWLAAVSPLPSGLSPASSSLVDRTTLAKQQTPEMPIIVFNSTQAVEKNLKETKLQLDSILSISIDTKLTKAPLSSPESVSSPLRAGRFLVEQIDPARLYEDAKQTMELLSLAAVLRSQNAMMVVRKSMCHKSRDESPPSRTKLSFCASDGTLIELFEVNGSSLHKDIYNGDLFEEKYGLNLGFLASEATKCFEQDPKSLVCTEACRFNVPICKLNEPRYEKMLEGGESIINICRQEIGLSI